MTIPSPLKKWQRVSGLLGNLHCCAFVTSSEWGILATEVAALALDDGIKTAPTPANFQQCYIGKNLLLRNAGTEDQEVVNAMNWIEIGEHFPEFDHRRRMFQTGRG